MKMNAPQAEISMRMRALKENAYMRNRILKGKRSIQGALKRYNNVAQGEGRGILCL